MSFRRCPEAQLEASCGCGEAADVPVVATSSIREACCSRDPARRARWKYDTAFRHVCGCRGLAPFLLIVGADAAASVVGPISFLPHQNPSMMLLLSTCAVVGPVIFARKQRKAVNSTLLMVRCTLRSSSSVPHIAALAPSPHRDQACTTNHPHAPLLSDTHIKDSSVAT